MTSALAQHPDLTADDAASVLVAARASRLAADREELRLLRLAVDWAAMHSVDSIDEAATFPRVCSGDIAFPVAGCPVGGGVLCGGVRLGGRVADRVREALPR
jgi:hypothetical protein